MDENEHASAPLRPEDTAEQPPAGGSVRAEAMEVLAAQAVSAAPEPEAPWSPLPIPPAPQSGAEGAWNFGQPARTSGFPKVRRPVALGLVVVLLAAVGAYAFLNRRSSSEGTPFALALGRDRTYNYDVRLGMEGTISMQGENVPFKMQMDQSIGWLVESTDSDGTATIAVNMQTRSAQFNGQPAPAIPTETTRIRVAKDGRILSADFGLAGLGSNSDLGSLVPGGDQFIPLLPDHPVKVGDSWTKKFDQELPFGMGRFRYSVDSSLLRYEMNDGKRIAVLFSTLSLPLDMTIDLKKLLAAAGSSEAQSLPGGGNPKIKFGGSMTMQQTAWFDQAQGELDRTTANATFDMSIEFKHFPQQANPPAGAMQFTGTMNLQVQRVKSAPTLTPKAQNSKAQANLRNALVAAKVHFTDSNTYRGFTPRAANRIEPSLAFNAAVKARMGQVSIRGATKNALLLVTRSATGKVFCIAERGGKIAYGRQDAKTAAGCRGGW